VPTLHVYVSDDEYALVFDMARMIGASTPGSVARQGLWLLASRLQAEIPPSYFSRFTVPPTSRFDPRDMETADAHD
jgi:hypothetical protein